MSRLLFCLIGLLLALNAAPRAAAQLQVSLQMNKTHYVAYEPVLATVTIANRAGKDIILGDANGRGWLTFNVDMIGGNPILPYAGEPRPQPKVLGAGKALRETFSLGRYYPVGSLGNYQVRANVYFSEFGQYIASNVKAFAITDGNALWEDQIGINVPGRPTSYRKMSLLSFQEDDKMTLYVRIREEQTGRVLATYALGRLVLQREPQATLDAENRLHAFFLSGPKYYRHIIISPDGEKISEEIYEVKGSSIPELKITDTGRVRVAGGLLFDPSRPAAPQEVVRRLTDRPPGVPEGDVEK